MRRLQSSAVMVPLGRRHCTGVRPHVNWPGQGVALHDVAACKTHSIVQNAPLSAMLGIRRQTLEQVFVEAVVADDASRVLRIASHVTGTAAPVTELWAALDVLGTLPAYMERLSARLLVRIDRWTSWGRCRSGCLPGCWCG
jgi:hypothetical protein